MPNTVFGLVHDSFVDAAPRPAKALAFLPDTGSAVTIGCGRGNMNAALGEAAFMTGMERNSDVVVMASYAPLFARPGYEHWNPNAIVFGSATAYGTPSYYVQ